MPLAPIVLALAFLMVSLATSASAQRRTELSFTAEINSVANPVQLPPQALAILVSDKTNFKNLPPNGLRCTNKETYPLNQGDPVSQILCTVLPLSSAPGKDYLVIGIGSLRGAHIIPFWIIHVDGTGASLFFKDRSDGITVLPTRYHHYRELEIVRVHQAGMVVETDRFSFNGKKYVRISTREDHH